MKHDLGKIVREAMKNVLKEMDAVAFKEKMGCLWIQYLEKQDNPQAIDT